MSRDARAPAQVPAMLAYPNPFEGYPWVVWWPCPGCGREHVTGALSPEIPGGLLRVPSCGKGPRLVEIVGPPVEVLDGPPLERWEVGFEVERRRARGGRPRKDRAEAVA